MLRLIVKIQSVLDSMKDESGQDLVEYALLGALIAVAAVTAMGSVATNIGLELNKIAGKLT